MLCELVCVDTELVLIREHTDVNTHVCIADKYQVVCSFSLSVSVLMCTKLSTLFYIHRLTHGRVQMLVIC